MRLRLPKIDLFFRKNGSTILSIVGAIGVVGTAVLTAKATVKAVKIKEDLPEDSDIKEVVLSCAPAYIPAVATGIATISCIFGANVLSKKNQASIAAAYGFLNNSYLEFRKKAKEIYGETAASNIQKAVAKDKYDPHISENVTPDTELYYYEYAPNNGYFNSTSERIKDGIIQANRQFATHGVLSVNDFLIYLGLDTVAGGDLIGWDAEWVIHGCWLDPWIEVEQELVTMDDGLEVMFLSLLSPINLSDETLYWDERYKDAIANDRS